MKEAAQSPGHTRSNAPAASGCRDNKTRKLGRWPLWASGLATERPAYQTRGASTRWAALRWGKPKIFGAKMPGLGWGCEPYPGHIASETDPRWRWRNPVHQLQAKRTMVQRQQYLWPTGGRGKRFAIRIDPGLALAGTNFKALPGSTAGQGMVNGGRQCAQHGHAQRQPHYPKTV